MSVGQAVESSELRCSEQTAALGEPPAGTAGFARRVLLVELPMPWPRKIDQHELLTAARVGDDDVKLLGIRAAESDRSDEHRIVVWERTDPFAGFVRGESMAGSTDLVDTIARLAGAEREDLATLVSPTPGVEDLLVCTHGSRDRCCGQAGTLLHMELAALLHDRAPNHREVRLWRTSHIGGHRFAPTALHLPSGTTWASLTKQLTMAILDQSVPTHQLESHFRGNLGIAGRPAQIAEGRAFLERGWPFLERERAVDTDEVEGGRVVATVRSEAGVHRVHLEAAESIPVPPCGAPLEDASKATPQFVIAAETNH